MHSGSTLACKLCSLAFIAIACGSAEHDGDKLVGNAGNAGAAPKNAGGSAGHGGRNPIAAGGTHSLAGTSNQGGTSHEGGASNAGGALGDPEEPCKRPVYKSGNWIICDNGLKHRESPGACKSNLPRTRVLPSESSSDKCRQDSDCTARPHGYCESTFRPPEATTNICHYGCTTDSECAADELCICLANDSVAGALSATIGSCVRSNDKCRSDADCGQGFWCTNYVPSCWGSGMAFACQTAEDACASDADCPKRSVCGYENGARLCKEISCER
jgi:hypothetical protein